MSAADVPQTAAEVPAEVEAAPDLEVIHIPQDAVVPPATAIRPVVVPRAVPLTDPEFVWFLRERLRMGSRFRDSIESSLFLYNELALRMGIQFARDCVPAMFSHKTLANRWALSDRQYRNYTQARRRILQMGGVAQEALDAIGRDRRDWFLFFEEEEVSRQF
jgi:hypothetical protein